MSEDEDEDLKLTLPLEIQSLILQECLERNITPAQFFTEMLPEIVKEKPE